MNIVWGFLVTVGVTALAVAAMLLVRRRAPEGSYFKDGDRASGVFGVLATGFSVLLGFIIFLAFTSYDQSRTGAENEAPQQSARRIGDQKPLPVHAVHAGQNARQNAQHGNEATEEHDLAAVTQEQVLADLQPGLVEPEVAPVARDQRRADPAADQVADIVTQDGGRGGHQHDRHDVELVGRAGIERGRQQRRLARDGYADGFEGNHREQRPQAVGVEQVMQGVG